MPDRYQSVLLFGAPGAGKGTQGKILGQIPGFYHLSTGEIFRTLDTSSELGKIFYQYSSQGLLVPDDITVRMWSQHMYGLVTQRAYKPEIDLLVLDGIPRNIAQARLMHRYIDVLCVVHLVCSDKEAMIQRLRRRAMKEGRVDDAREETIRRRWDVYEQDTFPVLGCYDASLVQTVTAEGSPAGVLQRILQAVVPIQETHFHNPVSGEPLKARARPGEAGASSG